jgi:hypothetical protein
MQNTIDISKLNKAELLAALYNASHQQGMGFLQSRGTSFLTAKEAEELLKQQHYFDYLYGRVMKIDLSSDKLDPWLYDRDNGQGTAQLVVNTLLDSTKQST